VNAKFERDFLGEAEENHEIPTPKTADIRPTNRAEDLPSAKQ
jgi:hypothetical protein